MGRLFIQHIENPRCHKVYACGSCSVHLASGDDLLSTQFHSRSGPAYLYNQCINIVLGEQQEREMATGNHIVRDIVCINCNANLGWRYDLAIEQREKYKEGKYILERAKLVEQATAVSRSPSDLFDYDNNNDNTNSNSNNGGNSAAIAIAAAAARGRRAVAMTLDDAAADLERHMLQGHTMQQQQQQGGQIIPITPSSRRNTRETRDNNDGHHTRMHRIWSDINNNVRLIDANLEAIGNRNPIINNTTNNNNNNGSQVVGVYYNNPVMQWEIAQRSRMQMEEEEEEEEEEGEEEEEERG